MLEKLPEAIGHALQGQRAGIEGTAFHKVSQRHLPVLTVLSSAFKDLHAIPVAYTADGAGLSPPLVWQDVPDAASRVVLIVEDADSPTPQPLVHAIAVFGSGAGALVAGDLASPDRKGRGVATGLNSYLQHAWLPPDPPPGHGEHRYAFQVFALDANADLPDGPGRGKLVENILEHAIAAGCLIGVYSREKSVLAEYDVGSPAAPEFTLIKGVAT